MNKTNDIKMVPVEHIVPNPKNNNLHPSDQIDTLCKIIEFQGFREPVIVSKRSGFLITGHARLQAAKKLGLTEIPVMYQDFDNEAQEYAHMTADNAIPKWAMLNTEKALEEIKNFDLDMSLYGLEELKNFEEVPEVKEEEKTEKRDNRKNVYIVEILCEDELEMDDLHEEFELRELNVSKKVKKMKSKEEIKE
jgi:hypothetical protein